MKKSKTRSNGSILAMIFSTLCAIIMVSLLYTSNKVWTNSNFSYVDGMITNGTQYQIATLIVENTLEEIPSAHLKLLVDEGWSIDFIKQSAQIDSTSILDEFSQGGAINPTDKKIYLTPDFRTIKNMTGHEIGHALDYICRSGGAASSDSEQFQTIYNQENKNKEITSSEFFAEIYAKRLMNQKKAESEYPLAVQYIQSVG